MTGTKAGWPVNKVPRCPPPSPPVRLPSPRNKTQREKLVLLKVVETEFTQRVQRHQPCCRCKRLRAHADAVRIEGNPGRLSRRPSISLVGLLKRRRYVLAVVGVESGRDNRQNNIVGICGERGCNVSQK